MKTQYALVGTWKMSLDGLRDGADLLKDGAPVGDAIETAIRSVEENPSYVSVGYGGLPARDGQVYLDSAYMDGNSLRCGAVLSVTDLSSPIAVSRRLCGRRTNWMLAGDGARAFAQACGIPLRDMRTPASRERWEKAMEHFHETEALTAYRGHDTVCVLGVDLYGSMASGTSTSGLFQHDYNVYYQQSYYI